MKETELDAEIKKGKATQDQLRIWDNLLEIRIQMQKVLLQSNILPREGFEDLCKVEQSNEEDDCNKTLAVWKNTTSTIKSLLQNLLDLQDILRKQNPEVQKRLLGKRKAKDDVNGEEEIPSDDEEITSSEDEKEPDDYKNGDASDDEEAEGSDVDDDENDNEEMEKEGVSKKKRKIVTDYETEVQQRFNTFTKFRNEVVQKWNEKTQVSSGNFNKRNNFTAFQTSTLSQIEHILKDKSRLIKRTQLKRSNYSVIGQKKDEQSTTDEADGGSEYDPEIFDDDDFYHQILRELIDRKTSNVTDPVELSRHWLQIQKLRSKLKRKVDTKASKGRKIRYDVHPKLVNFMASYDDCPMTESSIKELYSSLFGHKRE